MRLAPQLITDFLAYNAVANATLWFVHPQEKLSAPMTMTCVLSATLNGESVLKGRSLFAHRVGELVAPPLFTLVDDATNPLAFSATPLDEVALADPAARTGVARWHARRSHRMT